MPLPKRKKEEKEQDFVNRCMSDPIMKKDFPTNAQRVAVCLSLFKKGDTNEDTNEEVKE